MTEEHEQLSLPLSRLNDQNKKVSSNKQQSIGVVQLVDALRLVERQLPIVLSTEISDEEKSYILYLADRALEMGAGGQYAS